MELLRTPDERFRDLPDYPFAPHYVDLDGVRMHYVVEGPANAEPVLLLHGEPSWSYLYRHMIPVFSAAGYRVIAPDLIGFGRSDKPARRRDHTYARHVAWMRGLLDALDLQNITLVCQDWGGLVGLRLAAENEHRFARIVAANTGLPTGEQLSPVFYAWRVFSQLAPRLPVGRIIEFGTVAKLAPPSSPPTMHRFPASATKRAPASFPCWCPQAHVILPLPPIAQHGRCLHVGKSPSLRHLATPTPSRAAATLCSNSAFQGRGISHMSPSQERGTFCKKIRAQN